MEPDALTERTVLKQSLLLVLMVFFLGGCGPIAETFNQKGAKAFDLGDLATAKGEFQKALFLNGSNPAYHNNLGYVLFQLKDYDGAEREFQKALADHPGENLLRQVQVDQALLYCDASAAAAKPSHKEWNEKGIAILQQLLQNDPANAEYHMRLGFAYFRSANPGGGFSELDQAVTLATPEQTARYTSNPKEAALFILQQVQGFYLKVRLFKKAGVIQQKIRTLKNR